MKTFFKLFGLIVFLSFAGIPKTWALEGSTAFQGGFVTAFGGPSPLIASSGVNGFFYMDFKVVHGFYLGLGTSFTSLMSGTDRLYLDGTQLFTRVVPFADSSWNPYFMAGAGPRPFYDAQPNHRWLKGGDFQALGGLGVRHNLLPRLDLDLSVFYNLNTDNGDPLNSVGVRAGLAFPFGGPEKAKPTPAATEAPAAQAETTPTYTSSDYTKAGLRLYAAKKYREAVPYFDQALELDQADNQALLGKANCYFYLKDYPQALEAYELLSEQNPSNERYAQFVARLQAKLAEKTSAPAQAEPTPGPTPEARKDYILSRKGDSLWDTAARRVVLGDPELYPLLVDANRGKLPSALILPPGTKIKIPQNVTPKMESAARRHAWMRKYTHWRGRGWTQWGYQRWRKYHGLEPEKGLPDFH